MRKNHYHPFVFTTGYAAILLWLQTFDAMASVNAIKNSMVLLSSLLYSASIAIGVNGVRSQYDKTPLT